MAFPFRFQRRHVDNDAAAGIGAFAQADGQHAARNAEELDRARQREGVGRDDADIAIHIDEGIGVEVFRVDDGVVEIGEQLEFAGAAHVVAVAGSAVGNDLLAVDALDLARLEGFDHAVFRRHATDPLVGFDAHLGSLSIRLIACARVAEQGKFDGRIVHEPPCARQSTYRAGLYD